MRCRGFEIVPGEFSGCEIKDGATDCPICHGTGHFEPDNNLLLDRLYMWSGECRLDYEEALADDILSARKRIKEMRDALRLCVAEGCKTECSRLIE